MPLFARPIFSLRDLHGAYSFHFDGEAFDAATGNFESRLAAVGHLVADGNGNFTSGTRSFTDGKNVFEQTFTGAYTVNPDGTGHAVLTVQFAPNVVIVQEFDTVLTDDGNEFYFNLTKAGIPDVFAVVQGEGKKQVHGGGDL